jgi:hypothetical protein
VRKILITAAVALAIPAGAVARIHEPFTLKQARAVDIRYERHEWPGSRVLTCRRRGERTVICTVLGPWTKVLNGQTTASRFEWRDEITRIGPCRARLKNRSRTSGLSGTSTTHNCFNGPLVAVPAPDSLAQLA